MDTLYVVYPDPSGYFGNALFVRRCERCGRIVKAHVHIFVGERGLHPGPNANCSKCGPTRMLFQGFD